MNPLLILLTTVLLSTTELAPTLSPAPTPKRFSQSLQLERGWNLVSWYVQLPDPNTPPLTMDEVFEYDPGPPETWGWLNPMLDSPPHGDRVGRWNAYPGGNDGLYPAGNTSGWTWDLNKAYYIYRDKFAENSPAHFWECTNQDHVVNATMNLDPDGAWDEWLAPEVTPNFWWFLAYPLRMEQVLGDQQGWSSNATISYLENYTSNRLVMLKDDAGHQYIPGNRSHTTLHFLTPGKGYFAGFAHDSEVPDSPGFADEVEPANVPGGGSKSGQNPGSQIASTLHFTCTSRTHWWYPVVIDTAGLEGITPASGDEIGVFDGDLCVGAAAYPDSFPVSLAAWMDDIATPDIVDGYIPGHDMTFKWFDASTNQEITFVPPPQTESILEDDPIAPSHSGFGLGFYAIRSLTDGLAQVQQLPQTFKLCQNFPNPFNAETIIPLELPQRSHVKIELFNVRGQCLGVIFEGVENAGWPKIHYNASGLASGVYFCRVMAEGLERGGKYQSVGKMLLLK